MSGSRVRETTRATYREPPGNYQAVRGVAPLVNGSTAVPGTTRNQYRHHWLPGFPPEGGTRADPSEMIAYGQDSAPSRRSALKEDNVSPHPMKLPKALTSSDDTEPTRLVQDHACHVFRKDASLDRPVPVRLRLGDEGSEELPSDSRTSVVLAYIDAVFDQRSNGKSLPCPRRHTPAGSGRERSRRRRSSQPGNGKS